MLRLFSKKIQILFDNCIILAISKHCDKGDNAIFFGIGYHGARGHFLWWSPSVCKSSCENPFSVVGCPEPSVRAISALKISFYVLKRFLICLGIIFPVFDLFFPKCKQNPKCLDKHPLAIKRHELRIILAFNGNKKLSQFHTI